MCPEVVFVNSLFGCVRVRNNVRQDSANFTYLDPTVDRKKKKKRQKTWLDSAKVRKLLKLHNKVRHIVLNDHVSTLSVKILLIEFVGELCKDVYLKTQLLTKSLYHRFHTVHLK